MRTMNPAFFVRRCGDNLSLLADYERHLSGRERKLRLNERELRSLQSLIDVLALPESDWENFYYSYRIPHLGKEFDLLRVSDAILLNLELKSQINSLSDVEEQLQKNRYFLSCLPQRLCLFTYDMGERRFYRLTDAGKIVTATAEEVRHVMRHFRHRNGTVSLDDAFQASHFLVSPFEEPERFLRREYFLTEQQREICREICERLDNRNADGPFLAEIRGGAGTGKSLLVYDLARSVSERMPVTVVDCWGVGKSHAVLRERLSGVRILSAGEAEACFGEQGLWIFDEAHRMKAEFLERVFREADRLQIPCLFSLDPNQVSNEEEQRAAIGDRIDRRRGVVRYRLTDTIRTNREVACFVDGMFDGRKGNRALQYPHIRIYYAESPEQVCKMLEVLSRKGIVWIDFSETGTFTRAGAAPGLRVESVVGREFEGVVVCLEGEFFYEKGRLRCSRPILANRLYQAVTRAKTSLAVIVLGQQAVLERLLRLVR